jgi:nucleoside triphosphate pyrophosphatase
MRLILASASPRRAELLRAAGYAFEIVVANVDESMRDGESPSIYVRRLAAEKSAAVGPGADTAEAIVLGADTTVVIDDEMLGKPDDDNDSARMMRRLSGREHQVLTGISLRRGAVELGCVETTSVFVAPLSDDEIAWYVATGEGRDKAGAYAIQGVASRFIPRIEGSYSNVVGLPITAVRELLIEISGTRPDRSYPSR